MAMLRALGGRSLTTRPPISTAPDVSFSSPAMVRMSVVLPEPEAPSSTRNSPSRTARSTPSTARTPAKCVCSSRTSRVAMSGRRAGVGRAPTWRGRARPRARGGLGAGAVVQGQISPRWRQPSNTLRASAAPVLMACSGVSSPRTARANMLGITKVLNTSATAGLV